MTGEITDVDDVTLMDAQGAVRSVQTAVVAMPADAMPPIWTPIYLERLARTYWAYLSRISLGLIRVEYSALERRVVLLRSPFVFLRFRTPEYDTAEGRGTVRWRIRDGVLVARRDEGTLEIRVQRLDPTRAGWERAQVTVEVTNFYPAVASWLTRQVYLRTQSRLHVLITHGFLRSLVRRELEVSAVGRHAGT
jgi:hypothetical protein